ncbi:MAG TPA: CPBP family glutamic-type intramembrane protease, partial [Candidatus Baltobacteraceae bacterium]|nr:CPBP family glutamic-type intramembrane protease [Candidatus Baltobacteraceae bacterium]
MLVGVLFVERGRHGRPAAAVGFDPNRAPRDLSLGVAFGALLCSLVIIVPAIALASGAAHAFNSGATFVLTRNLWMPIGLHFAWNFCEESIYGAQVSGHAFLKR